MNLFILQGTGKKELLSDSLTLTKDYLNHKPIHLFLASYNWDKLVIELSDDMPKDCLKYLRVKVSSIEVKVPEIQTKDTMLLLTELYPEKAGKLRKQFMLGKSLLEVVNEE